MKKILLLSDTHGDLDLINSLVEKIGADLVIHAGDFGFYNEASLYQLSHRELRLLITHSKYHDQYQIDKDTDPALLRKIIVKHKLLGTFQDYLDENKSFSVPIYTVWGNHEDVRVLKNLTISSTVENLNLLHSNIDYTIDCLEGEVKLFGLGGNFLKSKKLFRAPIAGQAGKVFSTLHEYGALYKRIKQKSKPSIFVSHVSPGKEPLLARMLIHFMPDIWISGHMGAPYTCLWNQFTIREFDESIVWFDSQLDAFKQLIDGATLSDEAKIAADLIIRPIPKQDFWFKKLWNINLPDAKNGYAVLSVENGQFELETFSRGIKIT